MTSQRFDFLPHPRSGIFDLLAEWDAIDFDPDYQRKGNVWTREVKQYFVDSIINGMDIPKLYFHALSAPSRQRYGIIDGKQRMLAIREFVDGEFSLHEEFRFFHADDDGAAAGRSYAELLTKFPELRSRFDGTRLPIMVMYAEDLALIEGLFTRLNLSVPLNAPEKRNALGGPVPQALRLVVHHEFFASRVPISDDRYQHRDLAAKFFRIVKERRFVGTKKAELDALVTDYRKNESTEPSVATLIKGTETVLSSMSDFFRTKDPLLSNVGWITLFFHIFRHNDPSTLARLQRGMFEEFQRIVVANRKLGRSLADGRRNTGGEVVDPSLSQFDSLRQSPNDGAALRTRYSILRRWLEDRFDVALLDEESIENSNAR